MATCWHAPASHESVVHGSVSAQSLDETQHPAIKVAAHWFVVRSQLSVVHALPSLH